MFVVGSSPNTFHMHCLPVRLVTGCQTHTHTQHKYASITESAAIFLQRIDTIMNLSLLYAECMHRYYVCVCA